MQIKRQLQAALMAETILVLAAINSGSIAFAGGGPPPATHTHYRFTTIQIAEAEYPIAFGINNEGLVTGYYVDATTGYFEGYLYQNGTVTTVDVPASYMSVDTLLGGVNDKGVAIGNYDDAGLVSYATLYRVRDQTWTTLPDIAGLPINFGNAINNNGVAVGTAFDGDVNGFYYYNGVGWTWDGRDYSFITFPAASESLSGTFASGINDSGKVVGYYEDSDSDYHGFLKDGRRMSSFDVPGADDTYPSAINNQDEVVGYYSIGTTNYGFIMQASNFVTVDVPGAASTLIFGNNDRGEIVGQYIDASGNEYAFVATPIGRED
jgi:probable HAF family extracellular repeat protein